MSATEISNRRTNIQFARVLGFLENKNIFLAEVSSLEFLFLLFQDKRKHKRNIFSYVILKETKWIEESLNLDRFLLRRNDKIKLIKEDKTVGCKHPLPNFHLPSKKKFYEKNMAKRR